MSKVMSLAGAAALLLATSMAFAADKAATISKEQALKDIRQAGYTKVEKLHHERSGWVATALESGKRVKVVVTDIGVRKL